MCEEYKNYTDLELLEYLKKEEHCAIKEVYFRCYKKIEIYVVKNSGNKENARDLFQEVLIVLIGYVRKPDFTLHEGTKLCGFISTIGRNLWLGKFRKGGKDPSENAKEILDDKTNDNTSLDDKRADEKRYEIMEKAIENLSPECRKLLIGYYIKGKKLKDLAVEMDYTLDFIKQKKARCLKSCRKNL